MTRSDVNCWDIWHNVTLRRAYRVIRKP